MSFLIFLFESQATMWLEHAKFPYSKSGVSRSAQDLCVFQPTVCPNAVSRFTIPGSKTLQLFAFYYCIFN